MPNQHISWISKGAIMRKMAFKDRKAKLVAVSVDLNKKTISWRTAGQLSEYLDQASSMHEEWMGLYNSRPSLPRSTSTAPLCSGGGQSSMSSQTQSEFSPARGQLRGQKSSCNLSKITSIHFGPVTNNMKTVVSTSKMLQPWRCWSFEVKRPRPRSYDFVALGDKDAEHFVLGLQRVCPAAIPSAQESTLSVCLQRARLKISFLAAENGIPKANILADLIANARKACRGGSAAYGVKHASKDNQRDSVLYTPSALALVRMVTNDVNDEMPGPPLEMGEATEKSLSDILVDEVLDFTAMHTLGGEEGGVNGVEKNHEALHAWLEECNPGMSRVLDEFIELGLKDVKDLLLVQRSDLRRISLDEREVEVFLHKVEELHSAAKCTAEVDRKAEGEGRLDKKLHPPAQNFTVEDPPHDGKISTAVNEAQNDESTTLELVSGESDEDNQLDVVTKEAIADEAQSGEADCVVRVDEETAEKASAEGMAVYEIEAHRCDDDIDPDAKQEAKKQEDNTGEERSVASDVEEEGRFPLGVSIENPPYDGKISTAADEAQNDESTTLELVSGDDDEARSDAATASRMTGDGHNMLKKNTSKSGNNGGSTITDYLSNALGETEDNGQNSQTTADLNSKQLRDLSSANKCTIGEDLITSRNVEQPHWSLPLHVVVTLQSWVRGCRQRSRWPAQSRSLAKVIRFRAAQRASTCIKTSFPGFVAKIYHFSDGNYAVQNFAVMKMQSVLRMRIARVHFRAQLKLSRAVSTLQRIARGWIVRSGANARVEREKAAMVQVHKMKVMEKNKNLAQKPQAHIENANVERARVSTDTETGLICAGGNYTTGTETCVASYAENEVHVTCTSAHTNTANAEDKKLVTHTQRETLSARPKDAEFLKQENLETQTCDQPATNAKIPIISTNEMLINRQVQQHKEVQSTFTIQKSTKETVSAYAEDESLKIDTSVSSGSLDVSWLVAQVKGLAIADTCEVDWLVQEINKLAKKTVMIEAPMNADVQSHRAACNTTCGGMSILGGKESIPAATKESRVGVVTTVASKGSNTNEQVSLSLKKAKSSATSKEQLAKARQRGRSRRKRKRKRKTSLHVSSVQSTATTPLSAPAKLLQQPVAVTSMRMSTLHSLATVGATPMQLVELLERESSAMLYDKDATGNTALHWAATQGHDQVVSVLLHYKADCAARDNAKDTALHWACRRQHMNVIHALCRMQKAQKLCNWSWPREALGQQHPVGKFACEKIKCMILARGRSGYTALHLASMRSAGAVEVLLHHAHALDMRLDDDSPKVLRSLVDACDENLRTAMHFASINGDVKSVQALLRYGATVTVQDIKGRTPLEYAQKKRRGEVVACILAHMNNRGHQVIEKTKSSW